PAIPSLFSTILTPQPKSKLFPYTTLFRSDRIGIIGADDDEETFTMHTFGSTGVTPIYRMSLNDGVWKLWHDQPGLSQRFEGKFRSEEHTSELQSLRHLVCRLLLEKKKIKI